MESRHRRLPNPHPVPPPPHVETVAYSPECKKAAQTIEIFRRLEP